MILIKLVGFLYVFIAFLFWLMLFKVSSVIVQFKIFKLRVFDLLKLRVYLDFYRYMYIFVLCSIVGSIHFFIKYYMGDDRKIIRFVGVLKVFVLSMILLIVSPNLVFVMLGWDGLGFSRFVLVAWFGCYVRRAARLKTFLINRLGDGFFLISLIYFFYQGHFGMYVLDRLMFLVRVILVIAFYTKSAHFPFSRWLPDAMAAPTPVSALVHSSTLVTAGLYMLFRFRYVWKYKIFELIHKLGLWTLFLGRLCACFDQNSKKIVAYSTIRQLGLLRYVLGLGMFDLFFFYMMVHALFKALLFISVGSLMLVKFHNQDVRHLRNCWFQNPLISLKLFFRVFALSGFPFLSGFYIKELVVNGGNLIKKKVFSQFLFYLSIVFTVYYSFRLYNVMVGSFKYNYGVLLNSIKIPVWVYFFLYMSVIQVGLVLYKKYFVWLNFGSSVVVLLISLLGLVLSVIIRKYFLFRCVFRNFLCYVVYMFKLNLITVRFNKLLKSGEYFYEKIDKGFFLFVFIKRINRLFFLEVKRIFWKNYFLNWVCLLMIVTGFVAVVVFF